jgi:hypothetical protein
MKFNDVLTEERYLLHQDPLKGSKLDLSGANLSEADLSGANLSGANLRDANLTYANLSAADLSGADLRYANLRYANLRYASLRAANLSAANLRSTNLMGANLRDANLKFIDVGNNIDILTLQLPPYQVVVDRINKIIAIGCKQHKVTEWENFDDSAICKMDQEALIFWKQWRETILLVSKCSYDLGQ